MQFVFGEISGISLMVAKLYDQVKLLMDVVFSRDLTMLMTMANNRSPFLVNLSFVARAV